MSEESLISCLYFVVTTCSYFVSFPKLLKAITT